MDSFTGLLSGQRARNAFLLRALFDPPWAIQVEDQAPLTIVVMLKGSAFAMCAETEPQPMELGDVALIRGPDPYRMADSPDTATQILIGPNQQAATIDGVQIGEALNRGIRTWGNSEVGTTQVIVGTYNFETEVSKRLLATLPPLVVLSAAQYDSPFVELLAEEMLKELPGQEAILDRLLDLVLMSTIRAWFAQPEAQAPGWYLAQSDPVIGDTVRLLHENPAHPWTVAELATEAGMSRANLARRFNEVVGEPPMTFLTNWRITLAADLLTESDATVSTVARQVGYGTPYAFSAAFKRETGKSPTEYRKSV